MTGFDSIEEQPGSIGSDPQEEKLMHSVLEGDKDKVDEGKLVTEAFNHNISAFVPDMVFSQMVRNYRMAEQIYGERFIQLVSGYDASYIQRNIGIPEFRKHLLELLKQRKKEMRNAGLVEKDGSFTDRGVTLASLVLYAQELDHLAPSGFGEKHFKKVSHYGEVERVREYRKGDRFKDIDVRKTLRLAVRRLHQKLAEEDLQVGLRQSKAVIHVIYGLDSSSSMRGSKMQAAKKAGVALAFKAIAERDKVGLVVFGSEVRQALAPTDDFGHLLKEVTQVRAAKETDFIALIHKAIELFSDDSVTKHLVILTDALPTVGEDPVRSTLEAVSLARAHGITISVVGVDLEEGKELAKSIATLGEGRLYLVSSKDELDTIVLQDYFALQH